MQLKLRELKNGIISSAGNDTLITKRGETVTYWYEKQPGYWYPFNAVNRPNY